ncbi:MAG: glycosyltransferase family 2 protein [Bdellovibrionota bacterium]
MSDTKITVVIPALNEENAIGETVTTLKKVLDKAGLAGSEILVVNDGSTDQTRQIAEKNGARVVSHIYNIGYGRSLKDGILAASNDTIVITDADGTYPLDRIPDLLKEYQKGFHMIVGKREGAHYRESLFKMPLRRILRFIVEFTAGSKIPDINSGLRVFSKKDITPYFEQLCNTFSFTTSVTLAYFMTGKFVGYIPIDYHQRVGSTKVKLFKDALRTLQYILQAVLYFNPIKLFMLLCGLTLTFSFLCLVAALITGLTIAYILGVGGILITLVIFSIGLVADQLRQLLIKHNVGVTVKE